MTVRHVAVWLDQHEARVFHVSPEGFDESTVHSPHKHVHRHPRGPEGYKEHPDNERRFFHEVARALDGAEEVLILGPSKAKLHFIRYAEGHDATLYAHIIGVETVDHPTDPQLAAHAKQYFKAADRLR
jgi:hypothetical protein